MTCISNSYVFTFIPWCVNSHYFENTFFLHAIHPCYCILHKNLKVEKLIWRIKNPFTNNLSYECEKIIALNQTLGLYCVNLHYTVSPVASANTSTCTNKHHRTGSLTSSFSEFSRKMRPKTLQMDGNKPSIYKSSSVPMNLQTDISPGKITLPVYEVNWVLWLDVVLFFSLHFGFPVLPLS